MADWGSIRKGSNGAAEKVRCQIIRTEEGPLDLPLTVMGENCWNSSFSGAAGKEVHRVVEGVEVEEMEEAGSTFKSLDEAEEKWDNGNYGSNKALTFI